MKTVFNPDLKARVSFDTNDIVRAINHSDALYYSKENSPKKAAVSYLKDIYKIIDIDSESLQNANQAVSYFDPKKQTLEYRLSEVKSFFDSTTLGYYQTYNNVPIWRTGVTVTLKHGPNRVVHLANNSKYKVSASLPSQKKIDDFKQFIETSNSGEKAGLAANSKNTLTLRSILNPVIDMDDEFLSSVKPKDDRKKRHRTLRYIRGRFYMYQYEKDKRHTGTGDHQKEGETQEIRDHHHHSLPLPDVDKSIKDGAYYLVTEITFSYNHVTWLMLVDVATSSILYLEALSSGVDGLVFVQDPVTVSGDTANGPTANNTTLNPFRTNVVLENLDPPSGGDQSLSGTYAVIQNETDPNVIAPTETSGDDFDYNVRTNDFAAVNAYYHTDRFFQLVEDLGFPVSTYFNNTTFPIVIDHRGLGSAINAHCVGNGLGGIDHCCYALSNASDTTNPMGIAADWKVHLHELGGHGVLYEHVGSANFGFAHSAGDSFAMILSDPESNAPDRFFFLPFEPSIVRRSDRPVSTWAWGGSNDVGGYSSEQILSTTLFRVYQSIGGDSSSLSRRKFAAEMMTYLMLRTISSFTPSTNPSNALDFCNAMMATDLLNWTSRGLFGGAYNKVVRWSFEKQGLFQPVGAPVPVTSEGDPPAVDVYIEDGRNGEYQYQGVHWNCQSIWNNNSATFNTSHEQPILGSTNRTYVKVKNRGTQVATGVNVRAFHCLPGAGLNWPTDFVEMTYTGPAIPNINPNSSEEITVGPFEWTPNINAYGHDCIIVVASAVDDPSNIDHFTVGETISEWRLVPNDNNVAQRNVHPVPGGGGLAGLVAGLQNRRFWAGNPFRVPAEMSLDIKLPGILEQKGWDIGFHGVVDNMFVLQPGEKKELVFDLKTGANFSQGEMEAATDRDIVISVLADGAVIGGMTYHIDPKIKAPINKTDDPCNTKCHGPAQELLKCLNVSDQNIKQVSVKKVSLDIIMDNEDCSC